MADYEIPGDLRFSREDEWVREDGEQVVIGISDYAQQQLGDIVFVELPAVGDNLIRGDSFEQWTEIQSWDQYSVVTKGGGEPGDRHLQTLSI